jgi:hypothetical protein
VIKACTRLAWVPVALLLAACAAGRTGGPAGPTTKVAVENNLVPSRSVSVRLVSSAGTRMRLGEVGPRRTQALEIMESIFPGSYQLVAETSTGGEIVSRTFNLFPGAAVTWDLRNNTILVGGTQ